MKISLRIALGLTISAATLAAAAAEPTGNDGYLIVDNLSRDTAAGSGRNPGLHPMLCPPNTYAGTLPRAAFGDFPQCWDDGKQVRPVSAQQALDMAYGPNKALVVGVGPIVSTEVNGAVGVTSSKSLSATVIYFRRVAP